MAFGHVFEILNLICVANTTIVHFQLSIVHCEQLLNKPEFTEQVISVRNTFPRGEGGSKSRKRNAGGNLTFTALLQAFSMLYCTPFLSRQLR